MKSGVRVPLPIWTTPNRRLGDAPGVHRVAWSCIARARRIDGAACGSRATERSQDDAGLTGMTSLRLLEPCDKE
jgi:hypothetical protein